jgi:hypothetical protein
MQAAQGHSKLVGRGKFVHQVRLLLGGWGGGLFQRPRRSAPLAFVARSDGSAADYQYGRVTGINFNASC